MLTALLFLAVTSTTPRAGALIVTPEPSIYYERFRDMQGHKPMVSPEDIAPDSIQHLGNGIVVFQTGYLDVWVYMPGKGERKIQDLPKAEQDLIIDRLTDLIDDGPKAAKPTST